MEAIFFTVLGAVLLLLMTVDVYVTILHARGRSGPIGESLCRFIWWIARSIAFKISRPRRHRLLNYIGPMLMPALIAIYLTIVVIGWALIYYPRMPADFVVDPRSASHPLINSIYFSGITLTTVGYGDIAPRTLMMRILALMQSASGFVLISLVVSYLVAVYRALERKRAIALSFHHQAGEVADVVDLIAHHFVAGRFRGLEANLRTAARDLQSILESYMEHPIIRYFHPIHVFKGTPRILFLSLETCAVIRSCLDHKEYIVMREDPEVRTLDLSARFVLREIISLLGKGGSVKEVPELLARDPERARARFDLIRRRLAEAGIIVESDGDESFQIYQSHREDWEPMLNRFAFYHGYDWEEVTGDNDPPYANDESIERPAIETEIQSNR